MILVDRLGEKVMELGGRFTTYEGNFESVVAVVQKHYNKQLIPGNLYINRFPCFDKVVVGEPFSIISVIHKQTFLVSYGLVIRMGIKNVLGWIFGFNESCFDDIHKDYAIDVYTNGGYDHSMFPLKHINTLNDLRKVSVVSKCKKEGAFYKATSFITQQWLIDKKQFRDIRNTTIGNGISSVQTVALAKSISEVLERFSAGVIGALPRNSSAPKLDKILKLYLGSDKVSVELYNVNGLGSKKQGAIAGNILFYPYHNYNMRYGNSNAMSCHTNYNAAIENGLFELIERDCFILSWLLKSGLHHIKLDSKIHKLLKKLAIEQYDVHLFALHFDNPIPVVLAVCRDGKRISTSLGVGYSLDDAIHKALSESGQFGKQNLDLDLLQNRDDAHPIDLHIRQYLDETNFKDVSWYFDLPYESKNKIRLLYKPLVNLKQLVSYFSDQKTSLYVYKYKNVLLKLFGRVCVRVISDNHLPIWFGKKVPAQIVESDRLLYRKDKLGIRTLNLSIHPLG